MRPDKLLMLGVAFLGGYAVYRLVTAPKDQAPASDTPRDLRFANPQGLR